MAQILPHFIDASYPEQLRQTSADVDRLIERYGQSDQLLADKMDAIFNPEVFIEGWEGMTTRQWLERVREMIR